MPIVVENLEYTYSKGTPFEVEALAGVSLTINEGDFLGIIGHTGSGKSTLAMHLNGLEKAQSGKITVDGVHLDGKYDKRSIRTKVGIVFQYPEQQLFEETVLKDICFGPKNQGLSEEEQIERAKWAMKLMDIDYDTFAERSPFELSGGQKRRVAIAGVLAMKPKYLVLDEPAAGLDPFARKSLLELIKALHSDAGITIVMVSHSMDDIAYCVKTVVVMQKGAIVRVGTPEEIFIEEDFLLSIGLDIPVVAHLRNRLNEKCFNLPAITDAGIIAKEIAGRIKGAEKC